MKIIGFSDLYTWISGAPTSRITEVTTSNTTSWNTSFNTTLNANTSTVVSTSISTITSWVTSWVSSYQVSTQYSANTSWNTSWVTAIAFSTSATAYANVSTSATAYYSRSTSYPASYVAAASRTTGYYRNTTVTANYSATTSKTTSVSYNTAWSTSVTTYKSVLTSRSTSDGAVTCLVEGSLIHLADGTVKPIEKLHIGDVLLARTGDFNTDVKDQLFALQLAEIPGEKSTATILKLFKFLSKGFVDINNGLLVSTQDHYHIVKRNNFWICSLGGELQVGDFLLGINDELIEITNISLDVDTIKNVYLLDTEDLDTFYANNIYTHNAKIKF